MSGHHEDFGREEAPELGTNRGFGIVFAIVGFIVAVWMGLKDVAWWWLPAGLGLAFLILAFVADGALLAPLNRLWFKFGMLLAMIITPLIMGLIFYGVVTPTALLRRLFGASRGHWSPEDGLDSYWEPRDPPGPDPEQTDRQF